MSQAPAAAAGGSMGLRPEAVTVVPKGQGAITGQVELVSGKTLPPKAHSSIPVGERLRVSMPGGGGYGDPLLRNPSDVANDVREGYVSRRAARDLYGVVLDARGGVDGAETDKLRRRLREGRFLLPALLVDDSFERGAVSKRRICRLHPRDADVAGLQADDLVEIDSRRAAPLRAWLRIDQTVKPGCLPIDDVGLTILRASVGQRLEVRRISIIVMPQARLAEAAE